MSRVAVEGIAGPNGAVHTQAMTGLNLHAIVLRGEDAERVEYPDDTIWLRAAGQGDLQVADYTSTDRDGPPFHHHPWDEAQIVIDGFVEFRIGDQGWVGGGSGTVTASAWRAAHASHPRGQRTHHPGVDRSAVRRFRPGHGGALRGRGGA